MSVCIRIRKPSSAARFSVQNASIQLVSDLTLRFCVVNKIKNFTQTRMMLRVGRVQSNKAGFAALSSLQSFVYISNCRFSIIII